MSKVTLDQILAGGGRFTRTKTLEIDGIGEFEIHEVPAAVFWSIAESGKGKDPEHYDALCAARFLKGDDPTDEEIKAVLDKLGRSVIEQIVEAGIYFDGVPEDLKKNS